MQSAPVRRFLLCAASVAALSGFTAPARAEGDLTLEGSVRARGEAVGGQSRAGLPDKEEFLSFQTMVFAEYDAGPVRFGAELLDARGYGQHDDRSAVTTNDVNALELLQGYVAVDLEDSFGAGTETTLTAGRFTMDLGSSRLVDRPSFANSPVSFTGANLQWANADQDQFFAFWTMPDRRRPDDTYAMSKNKVQWDKETTDLQFYGAHFTTSRIAKDVTAEAFVFGLNERDGGDVQTRNRRLSTAGMRLTRAADVRIVDFDIEGAYQFGTTRATILPSDRKRIDVSAHFFHAEAGRTFEGAWSPRLSLHFDHTSGDGRDPERFGRFDTLYGGRRTDFGPTSIYGPVSRPNLISLGLRLDGRASKRLDAFAMARGLWLEEKSDSFGATGVRDRAGSSGNFAGTQAEIRARYWIVPKVYRVEVGGAYLMRGEFLKKAPNANDFGDTRYMFVDLVREF